eukprot:2382464-Prymnesium_polylepis.2
MPAASCAALRRLRRCASEGVDLERSRGRLVFEIEHIDKSEELELDRAGYRRNGRNRWKSRSAASPSAPAPGWYSRDGRDGGRVEWFTKEDVRGVENEVGRLARICEDTRQQAAGDQLGQNATPACAVERDLKERVVREESERGWSARERALHYEDLEHHASAMRTRAGANAAAGTASHDRKAVARTNGSVASRKT